MDNYIVSARKYRPYNFDSVVGQDSIAHTLKNSIKNKQIAQAYLFCGPRGVGKTTCARIFAKTINCLSPTSEFEACEKCESCMAFNSLRSLNIHELDAASNNSVDDIRNLIDKVRIPPQIGNYSVYIIDEVHMLSSSAFNAFLKTLEEPPKYVVFILATTEKHKIIPTILSRCQIFDFNRIGIEDIKRRLEFVAKNENINAENDALQIIAQKADGAMRDALSIFDQIVSFTGSNITYEDTIKNLNVLDYEYYFKLTDAFLEGNYVETLMIFDEILNKGFEANYFINGLASHFRDLLMCKTPRTVEILEVGTKIREKYLQSAVNCSTPFLFNAINIANECDLKYKQSQNKRLLIELALLKISKLNNPEKFDVTEPKQEQTKTNSTPEKAEKHLEKTPEKVSEPKPKSTGSDNANAGSQKVIKSYSISEIANSQKTQSNGTGSQAKESGNDKYFNPENFGTDPFDKDKLEYNWAKYAETFREKDQRLFAYLSQHIPYIKENENIVLNVSNQNIKNKLEKIKSLIEQYLIKELNNKNLRIEFVVTEPEPSKTNQTDEEKLNSMISKNPEIKNLKDQLNLDFY